MTTTLKEKLDSWFIHHGLSRGPEDWHYVSLLQLFEAHVAEGGGWNYNMDEAPRDGTLVDLFVDSERITDCFWSRDGSCWKHIVNRTPYGPDSRMLNRHPFAWRLVPAPPNGKVG